MLVRIPPKYSVSEIMGYLKGKSSLMIFEKHANLKYKYGNRHFWCRGYYVDTVGKNAKKIQEYIQNQLKNDLEYDQLTLNEYIDPLPCCATFKAHKIAVLINQTVYKKEQFWSQLTQALGSINKLRKGYPFFPWIRLRPLS